MRYKLILIGVLFFIVLGVACSQILGSTNNKLYRRYFLVGWYSAHGDEGETMGRDFLGVNRMPPEDSVAVWISCYHQLEHPVAILSMTEMTGKDFAAYFDRDTSRGVSISDLHCK